MITSAPVTLLDTVWTGCNRGTSHSWERLNHAMSAALRLAVGCGMAFREGDIRAIQERYRSGYWIGPSWEWVCSLAVAVGNRSMIEEFERHFGRKPFIADRVRLHDDGGGFLHGGNSERVRERLVVGAEFPWKGLAVKVTSFANDQLSLTACSYRKEPPDYEHCPTCFGVKTWPREILDKRFRITPADIKADRAERKKASQPAAETEPKEAR